MVFPALIKLSLWSTVTACTFWDCRDQPPRYHDPRAAMKCQHIDIVDLTAWRIDAICLKKGTKNPDKGRTLCEKGGSYGSSNRAELPKEKGKGMFGLFV